MLTRPPDQTRPGAGLEGVVFFLVAIVFGGVCGWLLRGTW